MLSISNAIKDLNKTITPEGNIIGIYSFEYH